MIYSYGYQTNSAEQNHYAFSKPKFEFYPYSQPASKEYQQQHHNLQYLRHYPTVLTESNPNYYEKQAHHENLRTTVEIQPSHSYEIKETEHGYKTIYNDDHEHQSHLHEYRNDGGEDASPVIVLKIPGTQKYASHLQTLLKQYLEFRAAEYLQALHEQEAHGSVEHSFSPVSVMQYGHQQAYVGPIQGVLLQPFQTAPFQASPVDPYGGQIGYASYGGNVQHLQPVVSTQAPYEANVHHVQPVISTPAPYYQHQHQHDDHSGKGFFPTCILGLKILNSWPKY